MSTKPTIIKDLIKDESCPTITIKFKTPTQPEFEFTNWEGGGISIGAVEQMTHKLFPAVSQEFSNLRLKSIQADRAKTGTIG